MIFKLKKKNRTIFQNLIWNHQYIKEIKAILLCWKWLGVPGGSRSSLFSHLPSHPHPRPLVRGLTNHPKLSVQGSNFWITFPPTGELGTSAGSYKHMFSLYKVTLGSVFPGMLISSCWFIPISIMLMLLIFSRTWRYLTLAISLKNDKRKNELTRSPQV